MSYPLLKTTSQTLPNGYPVGDRNQPPGGRSTPPLAARTESTSSGKGTGEGLVPDKEHHILKQCHAFPMRRSEAGEWLRMVKLVKMNL